MRRTTFLFVTFFFVFSVFLRASPIQDFLFTASGNDDPLSFSISPTAPPSYLFEPIGSSSPRFQINSVPVTFNNVPVEDAIFLAPFIGRGGFSLETPDRILTLTGASLYVRPSTRTRSKAQMYTLLSVVSKDSPVPPFGLRTVPQMIAGVPETSTSFLVATGALGMLAMALKRNFSK